MTSKIYTTITKWTIILTFVFGLPQLSVAQTLTISDAGETGTSGTNWSTSGTNTVSIIATNTASINTSVIIGYLNAGQDVTIENQNTSASGGDIIVASDIITGAMSSGATLTVKAYRDVILNTNVTIDASQNGNTNMLTIILHSDGNGDGIIASSSANAGGIQLNDGASLLSNSGDVTLGGGLDISTGYALARDASTANTGIDLINAAINSSGGNIVMRGIGTHQIGESLGVNFSAGTSINSGSGTIDILGRSDAFLNSTTGLRNGVRFEGTSLNPVLISSSNTSANAVVLSGQEGYSGGAVNASGGSGSDREGLSFTYTDVSASGGVTFAADKQVYNNTTLTTSGTSDALSITSYENNSFWDAFTWNGSLSGANFLGSGSLSGITIYNSADLNGITIGKSVNESNFTVSAAITVAGPLTVYGGVITVNENLTSTAASEDIVLKGTGAINVAANRTIQTNNGDIIVWSDSDANDEGHIGIGNNGSFNSANGSTAFDLSGGGNITLAGGADDGANGGTASDGIPDGFARSASNPGIELNTDNTGDVSFYSGGGDVIINGYSTNNSGDANDNNGINQFGGLLINSGTGRIRMLGEGLNEYGINLNQASANDVLKLELISAATTGNAIFLNGTSASSIGLVFNFSSLKELKATDGGDISLNGVGGGASPGIFGQSLSVLASSGMITLDGGANGIFNKNTGNSYGAKAGTDIETSFSNIVFRGNSISVEAGGSATTFNTSGTVTLEPSDDDFGNTLTFPISNLTLDNAVSGLTIGKSATSADGTTDTNVTIAGATNIAGPITVHGGDIILNENLNTAGGALAGNVTLNAAGNITLAQNKSITTDGGDVIFKADADANRLGGIRIGTDFSPSTSTAITTNGGDIILSGGADPLTGFASYDAGLGDAFSDYFYAIGVFGATLDASGTADGGDITIRGNAGNTFNGVLWTVNIGGQYGPNTSVKTNGAGTISITGDMADAPANPTPTNSRNAWAVVIPGTIETENGNLLMVGKSTTARTNARGFALSGSFQSVMGTITIEDQTLNTNNANYTGPFISGAKIGKGTLTASSSDVIFKADKFAFANNTAVETSGAVTLEPLEDDFASAVSFTIANLSLDAAISGLTIGKSATSADGTTDANVAIASATSIAGPISVYGAAIALNAAVTATDSNINLYATGAVSQTAAITANNLSLNGTGTFTLQNSSNTIGTLSGGASGTRLGNIAYRDADALALGTVGSQSGLFSSGTILVETENGDLTLSQNINTTATSNDAIVLNAGRASAVGAITGGDIIVSGTLTLTTGSGGTSKLFSGSDANSTGLTTLVGGTGNARYNLDETSDLSGESLTSDNAYAIYREVGNTAPTVTSTSITSATAQSLYSYDIQASDAENDLITWTANTVPSWLTFTSGTLQTNFVGTGVTPSNTGDGVNQSPDGTSASTAVIQTNTAAHGDNKLFFTDTEEYGIRYVDANGNVQTWYQGDGTFTNLNPVGIAYDALNDAVYVGDYASTDILKIDNTGARTLLSNLPEPFMLRLLVNSNGSKLYASARGGIYEIDLTNNNPDTNWTRIVGTGTSGYSDTGTASTSQVNQPNGMAFDSAGRLVFTDRFNDIIRRVNLATDSIETIAGTQGAGTEAGDGGPAVNATFADPSGLVINEYDEIFISERVSKRIRKIDSNGDIDTFFTVSAGGFADDLVISDAGELFLLTSTLIAQVATKAELTGTPTNANAGVHNVALTLSDGTFNVPYNFQITVQAINYVPTDITLDTNSIGQSETGVDTTVGTLSTTDTDSGDSHTYSLVPGTGDDDNSSFNIDASSLRTNNALSPGSYNVRINTNDSTDDFAKAFTVTVIDDAGAYTTSETTLTVAENAGTGTFTVVLDTEPNSNVVFDITSNATGEATVSAAQLTFTSSNWETPQTITVTGVNDDIDRDDSASITIAVNDAGSDDAFDALVDQIVAITLTDDDTAVYTTSETALTIDENAGTGIFTIVLNSEPTSDVMLDVSSNDSNEATLSAAQITFTAANWNSAQTITITGVNDNMDRDDVAIITISINDSGSDDAFDALADQTVAITLTDDDTIGYTTSETALTIDENAGIGIFTIVLNSEPTSDVMLDVSSNNIAEATVSAAQITFTPANWNSAQTITITGVNDNIDRDDVAIISIMINDSVSDDAFDALVDQTVEITLTDDDVDSDGDGTNDPEDAFPNDPNEDTDTDGDGTADNADVFPNDPNEDTDTDGDGTGDNEDAFPNDPNEDNDSDNDGTGDNSDAFPNDANEDTDSDGDGTGDNEDAFPNNPNEDTDSDGDGTGDNEDAFPNNPNEDTDSDGDGTGDNEDAFPNDSNEDTDSDGDGTGDNEDAFPDDPDLNLDADGDGVSDGEDTFPNDPNEFEDTDGDGTGDNADLDDDNDGYSDEMEISEGTNAKNANDVPLDTDGDGIPDRMDTDDDNDGVLDTSDSFPTTVEPTLIPAEAFTPNGDGINDAWIVPGINNYPNNTVRVYNRWGHEVFAAGNYQNDWTGRHNDNSTILPTGSYLYVIDLGNGSAPLQGWIFINY